MASSNNVDLSTFQLIEELMGTGYVKGSMVRHEQNALVLLRLLKPRMVVEIGTHWGNSAVFWATHCECVVTFDIFHSAKAFELWEKAGLNDRIANVQIRDDRAKAKLLSSLDFDFAFVDGEHTADAVRRDFECVRKASAVLFHDYKPADGEYAACTNQRYPELAAYLDTLRPKVLVFGPRSSRMALWLNPERIHSDLRGTIAMACANMPFR